MCDPQRPGIPRQALAARPQQAQALAARPQQAQAPLACCAHVVSCECIESIMQKE